jgi:heme oxygenase
MLVRLGLETIVHHAQADDDRLAAMEIKTLHDYRVFLERIYGFEAPAEHAIYTAGLGSARDRGKTSLLVQDLTALGTALAGLPSATRINVKSAAHALGWLFVLERHTLLAGLVRRHVQRTLGAGVPVSYLSAYGETPGARFRALGEELGKYALQWPPSAIIAGTNDAFRAQRTWYTPAQGGELHHLHEHRRRILEERLDVLEEHRAVPAVGEAMVDGDR